MKKKLFYYLFAVLCTATLFTSCSDDDDNGKNGDDQTEVTDISGNYKGNLVVSIDGSAFNWCVEISHRVSPFQNKINKMFSTHFSFILK